MSYHRWRKPVRSVYHRHFTARYSGCSTSLASVDAMHCRRLGSHCTRGLEPRITKRSRLDRAAHILDCQSMGVPCARPALARPSSHHLRQPLSPANSTAPAVAQAQARRQAAPAAARRQAAPVVRYEGPSHGGSTGDCAARSPATTAARRRRHHDVAAPAGLAAGEKSTGSRPTHAANLRGNGVTRRQVLQVSAAAAALWGTAAGTPVSAAAESTATNSRPAAASASTASPAATDFELFRGKGGFTLRRPSNVGWVTAFVRRDL